MSDPWDPLPGEKARAYAAFTRFRDLPKDTRNLPTLAQALYGVPNPNRGNIKGWSTKNRWLDRVSAWDQHLDDIARAAIEDEIKKQAEAAARERVEVGREGIKLALRWIKSKAAAEDISDLPASVVPPLIRTCSDLCRLEEDLSTENMMHQGEGVVIYLPDNGRDKK